MKTYQPISLKLFLLKICNTDVSMFFKFLQCLSISTTQIFLQAKLTTLQRQVHRRIMPGITNISLQNIVQIKHLWEI